MTDVIDQGLGRARMLLALFASTFCALFAFASPASGQTTQYTNTTSGTFNGAGTLCTNTSTANRLTRTFTVPTSGAVTDVNLGILVSHLNRGDLRVYLRSPLGTQARLFNQSGGAADHLNVLFDDEAAANVSTHTANNSLTPTPPPYQNTFIPNEVMSIFDGENAAGTWSVDVCDRNNNAINGTFLRSDLYITTAPPPTDLSLTKTVSNAAPSNGVTITYTLSATNASTSALAATGVTVTDNLPAGVSYLSSTGSGFYDSTTGIWTVGSLAIGETKQIVITATVTAASGSVVQNGAEVRTSSGTDPDSTPNNGSTAEDDDAFVSFTVSSTRTAGTAPGIICPVGSNLFNWGSNSWAVGSLNNSYTLAGVGNFNITMTSTTPYVTGSPAINGNLTGGVVGETSLYQNLNNNALSDIATTVITMPGGLPGMQFRLFDIDFFAGQFADKITVTGSYNGSPVIPILTNGVSNYVVGNTAIGDLAAGDTTADGTVVVTFNNPVDTVTVVYGNHTTAPANPGNQWIGLGDLTFCNSYATSVTVSKISQVLSDSVSASNPKAIPGATVRYCITFGNTGTATVNNVSASDPLPSNVTFVSGTMRSGTTCGTAATVEDDNSSGADEIDPFGMFISGSTVTGTATTIAGGGSYAMVFNVTVD